MMLTFIMQVLYCGGAGVEMLKCVRHYKVFIVSYDANNSTAIYSNNTLLFRINAIWTIDIQMGGGGNWKGSHIFQEFYLV